jgi:tRNA(Ile)-lysidine synthase
MLVAFLKYLREKCGVDPSDRVLLACSGGVDSMVLASLFQEAGQPFALAHCNFQLRGTDSDADEDLVKDWAKSQEIPVFTRRFDTVAEKKRLGTSTQVTARELRYGWFREIVTSEGFDHLATAHHLDDSIETFFINLIRGSGIAGLTGIPYRNGNVIRPLLFATKDEIREYAGKKMLSWREDASNSTDAYLRNRIRQDIVPLFTRENPDFRQTFQVSAGHLSAAQACLEEYLEILAGRATTSTGTYSIKELRATSQPSVLLHYMFGDMGFTGTQFADMVSAFDTTESKRFLAGEYRITISRGKLKLEQDNQLPGIFVVETPGDLDKVPFIRSHSIGTPSGTFPPDLRIAHFDLGKLEFPLVFDHWKQGDYFYPLGMKGKKLLSDYFTDTKTDPSEREKQWLMRSGGQVAWVVGRRTDERSKITPGTNRVLSIEIV